MVAPARETADRIGLEVERDAALAEVEQMREAYGWAVICGDARLEEIDDLRAVIAEAIEDATDAVDAVVNASPWQNGAATQGAATIAILAKVART